MHVHVPPSSLARACLLGAGLLVAGVPAAQDGAPAQDGTPAQGGTSVPGGAILYTWVDEQGVRHYADRPRSGAREVEVRPAQGYRAPPSSAGSRAARNPGPTAPAAVDYARLEILRPAPDEVFINPGGPIDIAASVQPSLGPGHEIWFMLDGQRIPDVPTAATATAVDVPRGTHSVSVRVVDATGRTLATSPAVTFHVRRTSIAEPPRGPLLRPGT